MTDVVISPFTAALPSPLEVVALPAAGRARSAPEERLPEEEANLALLAAAADRLGDMDLDGLVDLLSRFFGCPVAFLTPIGSLLSGSAAAVPRPHGFRTATDDAESIHLGGQRFTVGPELVRLTTAGGRLVGFLARQSLPAGSAPVAWRPLSRILAAALAAQAEGRAAMEGSEGTFLLSILAGNDIPDDELTRWGRRVGYELNKSYWVAVLSSIQASDSRRGPRANDSQRDLQHVRAVRAAVRELGGESQPLVVHGFAGVICLCPERVDWGLGEWRRAWQKLLSGITESGLPRVAVGAAGSSPDGIRRSYRHARFLSQLQRLQGKGIPMPAVAIYGETGLAELLISQEGTDHVLSYIERILGPVMNHSRFGGELVDTLQAYLTTGGSPQQAAKLLHVHPSSVKYRMRFIRELVGEERLEDPETRFELELALRLLGALRELGGSKSAGQLKERWHQSTRPT